MKMVDNTFRNIGMYVPAQQANIARDHCSVASWIFFRGMVKNNLCAFFPALTWAAQPIQVLFWNCQNFWFCSLTSTSKHENVAINSDCFGACVIATFGSPELIYPLFQSRILSVEDLDVAIAPCTCFGPATWATFHEPTWPQGAISSRDFSA